MLTLTRTHPAFNLDLEILATLPTEPEAAAMNDLADDFGMEGQSDLREAFARLARDHDISIHVRRAGNGDSGFVASIASRSADRAREIASRYWRKVYGD